jgi:5-formyltetrahydrofolate cyclo-ligase
VHDISLDYVVPPKEIVFTEHDRRKPEGIYWELLEEEKLRSIPILRRLRGES